MHHVSPPAHGYPDDGEERPPFVLLEPLAYLAARDNATTATCEMRGFKGTFKVTFCTARPPLVSYMCFHATHYRHTKFAVPPQILAAETNGGLVLLQVVLGNHPSEAMLPGSREYLVYDASGPSLEHLPHPGDLLRFCGESVAFLRPFGSTTCYVIAAHSGLFGCRQPTPLCLYRSDNKAWSAQPLDSSSRRLPCHSTSKAITIGGNLGTVAWVDLWRNIIICDVLPTDPNLRSLQLPQTPTWVDDEDTDGDPRSFRDITLLDSTFKYVEMQFHAKQGRPPSASWEATVWTIQTGSSSAKDWRPLYKIKSSEIPQQSLPLLPIGPPHEETDPAFWTLHIGLPILSLQDAGIVYFLSKVRLYDHLACAFAVDMRNKALHKVGEVCPMRVLGLAQGYSASSISKFLKGTYKAKPETIGDDVAEFPHQETL